MLTHAEIVTRLQAKLWTATNTQWTSAIIVADGMTPVLKQLSRRAPFVTQERHPGDRPVPIRGEYTFDGSTRDIILTDWDADDMVKLSQENGVEYEVDQSPKEFRNFDSNYRPGQRVLPILLDSIPTSGTEIFIYPQRNHILQEAIGTTDTAGAVSTAAAIGATSLIVKGLGTGTINKYTKLTIAGDTTEYMVTATATIAANVATVTLTPALVVAADVDDVVTLALADSTMTPDLEEIFISWTAGQLIMDYGTNLLPAMPLGADFKDYHAIGKNMIDMAKEDLRMHEVADRYVIHPRD